MIGIYADVQIPWPLVHLLRQMSFDVLTSQADGTRSSPDVVILRRATELNRVVLTEDRDFLRIAYEWTSQGKEFCGILFLSRGEEGLRQVAEDIAVAVSCSDVSELANTVSYVPFR